MRDHPGLTTELEWRFRRMDDQVLCLDQALLLMEHLDPAHWAIQANATGIAIYPRKQIHNLTAWEKSLAKVPSLIPCDWTGYLQASVQPLHERWTKFSSTSSQSPDMSPTCANGSQEGGEDSSLNRLLLLMQAYLSNGLPMEVKSMEDVCRSICKAISGS